MTLIFKWLFIPYLLVILFAMFLGKDGVSDIAENNLTEEYFIIMFFLIIIDTQRIIIKWLTHTH